MASTRCSPTKPKPSKAHLRTRSDESPTLFTSNRRDPISRRQLDNLMKRYGAAAELPADKRHFHVLKSTSLFSFPLAPLTETLASASAGAYTLTIKKALYLQISTSEGSCVLRTHQGNLKHRCFGFFSSCRLLGC
jgi:hypothetical protein